MGGKGGGIPSEFRGLARSATRASEALTADFQAAQQVLPQSSLLNPGLVAGSQLGQLQSLAAMLGLDQAGAAEAGLSGLRGFASGDTQTGLVAGLTNSILPQVDRVLEQGTQSILGNSALTGTTTSSGTQRGLSDYVTDVGNQAATTIAQGAINLAPLQLQASQGLLGLPSASAQLMSQIYAQQAAARNAAAGPLGSVIGGGTNIPYQAPTNPFGELLAFGAPIAAAALTGGASLPMTGLGKAGAAGAGAGLFGATGAAGLIPGFGQAFSAAGAAGAAGARGAF